MVVAADEATLGELLEVLGEPIRENDLWALLTGGCLALNTRPMSVAVKNGIIFLTPQTIILCHEGSIRFAVKSHGKADPRFIPPESYSNPPYMHSKLSLEKMLVYSLGMVLYVAAAFGSNKYTSVSLSSDLEDLLIGMCEDNPLKRIGLKDIFPITSLYCDLNESANRISALVKVIVGNILPKRKEPDVQVPAQFKDLSRSSEHLNHRQLPALQGISPLQSVQGPEGLLHSYESTNGSVKALQNGYARQVQPSLSHPLASFNEQNSKARGNADHFEPSVVLEGSLTDFRALMELENRKLEYKGVLNEGNVKEVYKNSLKTSGGPLTNGVAGRRRTAQHKSESQHRRSFSGESTLMMQPVNKEKVRRSVSTSSVGETASSVGTSQYSSTLSLTHGSYNVDSVRNRIRSDSLSWQSLGGRSEMSEDTRSVASSKFKAVTKKKENSGPEFYLVTNNKEKSMVDITPGRIGPMPKGIRLLTVILPNLQVLEAKMPMASRVKDLFDLVCQHVTLKETMYFGLAQARDREHHFLELDSKLLKHSPPGWKEEKRNVDFILYFKVKIFIENLAALRHFTTRHLFYLQMRSDILNGYVYCEDDKAMVLAGIALQAEYGDYSGDIHGKNYFRLEYYLPLRIKQKYSQQELVKRLTTEHRTCEGISEDQAEAEFLTECQKLPEYGVLFYSVSRSKKNDDDSVLLGICVKGLIVFEIKGFMKIPIHKQTWEMTKEFSFRHKKFSVEPTKETGAPKMTFYTNHYRKSKYLLHLCQAFHKFHKLNNLKIYAEPTVSRASSNQGDGPKVSTSSNPPASGINENFHDEIFQPLKRGPPESNEMEYPSQPHGDKGMKTLLVQTVSNEGYSDDDFAGQSPHLRRKLSTLSGVPERKIVVVQFMKKKDQGLGITIVGGEDSKRVHQGIFIKSIKAGGLVAQDGRLQRGDRILAVNGKSLESVTHDEAVETLKNVTGLIEIIVSQISNGESIFEVSGLSVDDFELTQDTIEPDILEEKMYDGIRIVNPSTLKQNRWKEEHLGNTRSQVEEFVDETDLTLEESPYMEISGLQKHLEKKMSFPQLPKEDNRAKVPQLHLELVKRDGSLGISITGGRDSSIPGGHVIISELIPGGAAELSGNIKLGDCIVEVNGISLKDAFHKQAVEILKRSPEKTEIIVERFPDPDEFLKYVAPTVKPHDVVLPESEDTLNNADTEKTKTSNKSFVVTIEKRSGGLGLNIAGGKGSLPSFDEKVYVKKMFPGQPAYESRQIEEGDCIVKVNGIETTGLTKRDVIQMLREASSPVELALMRPAPEDIPSGLSAGPYTPPTSPDQLLAKVQSKIKSISGHQTETRQKQGDIEPIYAIVNKKKSKEPVVKAFSMPLDTERIPTVKLLSATANYAPDDNRKHPEYNVKVEVSPRSANSSPRIEHLRHDSRKDSSKEMKSCEVTFQSPSDLDNEDEEEGLNSPGFSKKNFHGDKIKADRTSSGIDQELSGKGQRIDSGDNIKSNRSWRDKDVSAVSNGAKIQESIEQLQSTTGSNSPFSKEGRYRGLIPVSSNSFHGSSTLPDISVDDEIPPLRLPTPEGSSGKVTQVKADPISENQKNAQDSFENVPPLRLPTVSGRHSATREDSVDVSTEQYAPNLSEKFADANNMEKKENDDSNEFRLINVDLEKGGNGLGFSVAGGYSTTGGCFVREIVSDPAVSCGQIKTGDHLIEVNGIDVTMLEHSDTIDILRTSGKFVHLVLRRRKQRTVKHPSTKKKMQVVMLARNSRGRFGLILGEDKGFIIVKDVVPNEPAARDGRLRFGDRVLEINDEPTQSLSLQEASGLLNVSGPLVYLLVEKTKHDRESRYMVNNDDTSLRTQIDDSFETGVSAKKDDNKKRSVEGDAVNGEVIMPDSRKSSVRSAIENGSSFQNTGSPVLKRLDHGSQQASHDLSWISASAENKGHIISVHIEKGVTGLGLSLTTHEFDDHSTGVIIQDIDPDGPAAQAGHLKRRDRIIGINGRNVEHMTRNDIVSFLRQITGVINLEVFRLPSRSRHNSLKASKQLTELRKSLSDDILANSGHSTCQHYDQPIEHASDAVDAAAEMDKHLSTDYIPSSQSDKASHQYETDSTRNEAIPESHLKENIEKTIGEENIHEETKSYVENVNIDRLSDIAFQSEGIILPDNLNASGLSIHLDLSKIDAETEIDSKYHVSSDGSEDTHSQRQDTLNDFEYSRREFRTSDYELSDIQNQGQNEHTLKETSFSKQDSPSLVDMDTNSNELCHEVTGENARINSGMSIGSGVTSTVSGRDSCIRGSEFSDSELLTKIEQLENKLKSKEIGHEYQEIKKMKSWGTVRVGKRGYNKSKNRSKAPLPYDENRVHLAGGEELDYINASFIKIEAEGNQYNFIATQGPLNNTTEDFWRMVFENRVELIVMVTNDVENGKNKCQRYWPEIPGLPMKVLQRWSIGITNVIEEEHGVIRELLVKNLKTGKSSGLLHCWFKLFPESGTLKNIRSFAQFTADVGSIDISGPVVVHCSAGNERTGTFILSYMMYEFLRGGLMPNISQLSKKLAKQRSGLVHSKEQYHLIYKIALEILQMFQDTS